MQWLIAHMWMALAATGVLGLLFGWALRGLRLRGRLRKAEGERNIALGSLAEKETELEALYAAGRTPASAEDVPATSAGSNDQELRAALDERDARLQALSDELARSRAELNELRSSGNGADISAAAVGSAVAGMAAGAVAAAQGEPLDADVDPDEASLEWRNRYLESRVRSLEEQITAAAASAAPVQGAQQGAGGNVLAEKLKWQTDYLKQRLEYIEKHGSPAAGVAIVPSPAVTGAPVEPAATSGGTSDEEVASLRWRNRYLEGRLAYYEGDKAAVDDGDSGIAELAENAAAMPVSPELAEGEEVAGTAAEVDLSVDEPVEADVDPVETEIKDETPAPAAASEEAGSTEVAVAKRGVRPMALEGPVDGEGDDLTAIGGIGPKIQEVLNGFGVYHYDQIAAWTPENVEWVDDHLAFEGRIEREQWVQQAEALSNVG